MAYINVLDDTTIDKIAAGEVIERPSSVVKELVENAIDAGASSISVEIKDGGISYIRVTDNGSGIERSQIKKAFMRHATSKISDVMDLYKIFSLGFRGEALSSISSVASVELLTKTSGDFSGVRYVISGKREEVFEDAGVPDGTTIIVRNLFYNTPARRKFLKSPNTEASHITELIERLILSHPDISIKYMINGMDKLVSSGRNDIKETIYSVYGKDCVKGLIPLEINNEIIKVSGFIGKPEIARGNRSFEMFFVNKRCIKSNVLSKAVENAYKHRMMLHKYPFFVLYIDVDPARLDINVHPAKTEIKFMDEIAISNFITEEVDKILTNSENIPKVLADYKIDSVSTKNDSQKNEYISETVDDKTAVGLRTSEILLLQEEMEVQPQKKEKTGNFPEPFEITRKKDAKVFSFDDEVKEYEQLEVFKDAFLSSEGLKKHVIIGQVFDTYWLVQYENSLYIIDQHAAHEKVLYERLIKRFKNNTVETQMISPPIILSLSLKEEDVIKKYGDNLTKMGFEWEHFGGSEYILSGVPVDLYDLTERDYFLLVLDDLAEGKKQNLDAINDRIATMACKAAVKANMHLSENEAKALIDELLKLENPYNCPHGRPCIISYSKAELEKLFKRIV